MQPERFGRYEVLAQIGDGAMGRVYRALDPVVGRVVAIKTIKSEYLSQGDAAEYLKRFRREAQAAGSLNHPHIVSIFDVGDDHIVMEHLEGQTLQGLVKEKARLTPAEAVAILAPVAEALDHAHRQGIIHRDIKPPNIMILPDGRPKLMDFGVAHFESSVMTSTGQILGSPSYMAPEQVAGLEVTGRTDVYSLAVVAYEMVTGQRPFQGSTVTTVIYRIMSEQAPRPRTLNAALPTRYDEVFARALAKDPKQRFPTATALVAALELQDFDLALEAALSPPANLADVETAELPEAIKAAARLVPPPAAPATARPGRVAWALGAAALCAAGLAFILFRGAPSPLPPPPAALPPPSLEGAVEPTPKGGGNLDGAATSRLPPSPSAPRPSSPGARAAPSNRGPAPTPPPSAAPVEAPAPPSLVEGTLVELSPDITPPRRIYGEPAPYPTMARRLQLEGTVTLETIVNARGEPTELKVLDSAGKALDEAVLRAVATWRFEPAVKDGVKVSVRFVVKQTFERSRR